MIFFNPAGAPELACNECGCRWFDRMNNRCYECNAEVPAQDVAEFEMALRQYTAKMSASAAVPNENPGLPRDR